ncbi:hypothetical protein SAMN06295924_1033 [Rathayibacter rathayi NCPPB 2980 = VKM Ac-1601]|nr:hypothetical protein FB469_0077 [Rathayibacter rathayi]SOE03864.1 hypothetical protein SAMN06295924_1033 [Rathayibacter rathayi NCPPB 2980 = VKM Ac-1601]
MTINAAAAITLHAIVALRFCDRSSRSSWLGRKGTLRTNQLLDHL